MRALGLEFADIFLVSSVSTNAETQNVAGTAKGLDTTLPRVLDRGTQTASQRRNMQCHQHVDVDKGRLCTDRIIMEYFKAFTHELT